jgi:hypothetical protein
VSEESAAYFTLQQDIVDVDHFRFSLRYAEASASPDHDDAVSATTSYVDQIHCDEQKRHFLHPNRNIAASPEGCKVHLYQRVRMDPDVVRANEPGAQRARCGLLSCHARTYHVVVAHDAMGSHHSSLLVFWPGL